MILAGDDVTRKKPDPLIYNMARERLGLSADRCIVVEDSMVGLRAAVAAGMKCIITPTTSTASADFMGEGATAVVPALAGDGYRVSSGQGAPGLGNRAGELTWDAQYFRQPQCYYCCCCCCCYAGHHQRPVLQGLLDRRDCP